MELKSLDPGVRQERIGEFGLYAVPLRSSHHLPVIMVEVWK